MEPILFHLYGACDLFFPIPNRQYFAPLQEGSYTKNTNPSVTASEIAEKIGISKRATEKNLSKLKTAGILDRIGSDKTGQWIIKSSV